jgi:hypothetical protein
MKTLGKWMLGAALAAATLGMGTAKANAARVHVAIGFGGPAVAYVPPCPGPGYEWVAGYYNPYRVWVPGYWNHAGFRYGGPVVVGRHFDRGYYRGYRGRR